MEEFKQLILKHFEKLLVSVILLAAFAGTYLIDEKAIVLNFYYLPVLFSAYFLGRRMGVLTSVFSILAVLICLFLFPQRFSDLGGMIETSDVPFIMGWVSHSRRCSSRDPVRTE